MTAVTKQQQAENQAVARPLKVLVPLIKQDLEKATEVANEAASPYYLSIGEKLIEAKSNTERKGSWVYFVKQEFKISKVTAWNYMDYAEQVKNVQLVERFTYYEYLKLKRKPPKVETKPQPNPAAWSEAEKRREEQIVASRQERENQRKLIKKIFDLGYKEMAKRFHPDKGGTNEDFHLLQEARQSIARILQRI